jgi:hypothetical protein
MSNPTTPFSWQMPTATDLVTDLPADFEVFGQAVATSMADLLGGTSGQILAKNSNTDMDFVWIANDQGDITGITATTPLTGGGTSGAVTVGIQDALTTQKGAVQLSDSTSTTSSILAATPTAVKSAYDLANAAIPKSLIDAAGDLIVGTAADTAGRVAIGTAGQLLKVNSGATGVEWATVSTSPTFVGCSIYKQTTAQSLANGTSTAITFNAEEFDTDAFHDNSTNNTRITIPAGKAGKYLIIAAITFASSGTGIRTISVYKNGSGAFENFQHAPTPSAALRGEVSGILNLSVSDYLEVFANQQSGGNLDVNAGQADTRFAAIYLGA